MSIISAGVFDRYPNLKMLISEGGATWGPFIGDRMDEGYRQHSAAVRPKLERMPSEYLDTNVYALFQHDRTAVAANTAMGWKNICWAATTRTPRAPTGTRRRRCTSCSTTSSRRRATECASAPSRSSFHTCRRLPRPDREQAEFGPTSGFAVSNERRALEGLVVVDLSTTLTSAYTTMVFADYGAEVIQVERPGGSELRECGRGPSGCEARRASSLT